LVLTWKNKMTTITQTMSKYDALETTARIRKSVTNIMHDLADIYNRQGFKALGYKSMTAYMEGEFPEISRSYLQYQLSAGRTINNIKDVTIVTSLPESTIRPIAKKKYLDKPDVQREIWQDAEAHANGQKPRAKDVEQAVKRYESITPQKPPSPTKKTMNRTNDNIEWAAWSWNPVTGCLHNCDYCYARDIADRFYPQKFKPTYHPERLTMPDNTKHGSPRWKNDTGHMKVFTCSMADLFGKWVPVEWINSVLETIERSPQWTFLLLTKFPARMAEFTYPANVWLGTTVDRQHAVKRAETAFQKIKASGFDGICWLSCEPMLERLTFDSLDMFDWIVIGGASKSSKTPEYKPPFEDIFHLYQQARASNCQIYMKTNLLGERVREYPK
jgi:protein gp37